METPRELRDKNCGGVQNIYKNRSFRPQLVSGLSEEGVGAVSQQSKAI